MSSWNGAIHLPLTIIGNFHNVRVVALWQPGNDISKGIWIRNTGVAWIPLQSMGIGMMAFDLRAAEAVKIETQNGDTIKSLFQ